MRFWATKLLFLVAASWLSAPSALAQPADCHGKASPYRVYITAEGVRSTKGYVVTNLYGSDRRRWLQDNGWLGVWRDPARPGEVTACIYVPTPGAYALVVFHDANGDGVLNQGMLGLPQEGYGFSNNVRPFLMAPSLKSASFTVGAADTRLRIRLHYPP